MATEEVKLTEESRAYQYPGHCLQIVRPRTIRVSESGNHYIQDEAGNLIIAAPGWLWIEIDDNAKGWTF